MSWTLNGQPFAALGISEGKRELHSLSVSEFSFTADGRNVETAPLFNYGTIVAVANSGTQVFRGPVTTLPASGRNGLQSHSYTLACPWWYLERLLWQQSWKILGGTSTAYKTRGILGVTALGVAQNVGDDISAVVNYAIDQGVPIGIGSISVPIIAPPEEVKELTCAEVIRRRLRWAPDVVSWFDFSITPPKLHVAPRSSLSALALSLDDPTITGVSVTPRPDLQVPAVVLTYEITNSVDGATQTAVVVDAAPDSATGREIGALAQTMELKGSSVTTISQAVRTTPIHTNPATNLNALRRWIASNIPALMQADKVDGASHTPELVFAKIRSNFVELGESGFPFFVRSLAHPAGEDEGGAYELAPDNETKIYLDPSLPRQLLEGDVMPWMSGVKSQAQIIHCNVKWKLKGKSFGPQIFSFTVRATDATTRTYRSVASAESGEAVPTGVAAALHASLSAPMFSGSITREQTECSSFARPGVALNITAGQPAWATMAAPIQSTTEDLATGTTTVTFGPPAHLGPTDFIELCRMQRRTEGSTGQRDANQSSRQTGLPT